MTSFTNQGVQIGARSYTVVCGSPFSLWEKGWV
jgi:hypothetical protein